MDLSALIFVALAAAWAVYLVPKALRAHEVDSVTRGVDSFSDRMRILARREATSSDRAELVVGGGTPDGAGPESTPGANADQLSAADTEEASAGDAEGAPDADRDQVAEPPLTPARRRARREAARRAAGRRRRVLALILAATAVVAGLAIGGLVPWPVVAVPVALLVGWLVACRRMVRRERAVRAPARIRRVRTTLAAQAIAEEDASATDGPRTEEIPAVTDEPAAPKDDWDPVPITLPTYVAKAPAGRTVRTIDLDDTGVWSSGRNAADSRLAREAEQAEQARTLSEERRATGS